MNSILAQNAWRDSNRNTRTHVEASIKKAIEKDLNAEEFFKELKRIEADEDKFGHYRIKPDDLSDTVKFLSERGPFNRNQLLKAYKRIFN